MRKLAAMILFLSLIALTGCAQLNDQVESDYTYLAISYWWPTKNIEGMTDEESELAQISAHFLHHQWVYSIKLPADSLHPENYHGKGVRFYFESPVMTGITEPIEDMLLEPIAIEVIGDMVYGQAIDFGEGFMVLDRFVTGIGYRELEGNPTIYKLTTETQILTDDDIDIEDNFETVVNDNNEIVFMREVHG